MLQSLRSRLAIPELVVAVGALVLLIGAIEGAIQLILKPTFWQKTAWPLHDLFCWETFARLVVYEKLRHFENADPDIVLVGDSSGFLQFSRTSSQNISPERFS